MLREHSANPLNAWHSQTAEDVLQAQETCASGLSDQQAQSRLQQHAPNRLPAPAKRSAWLRSLLQFHNILIYVLLGSAIITALLDHWVDTLVILVVVANAAIGFVQEGKAEQAMNAIRQMLAPQAAVLRGGEWRTVPGEELVPGDIVLLEAGDKVPADLRLLQCHSLQIQEAVLTGESLPVDKDAAAAGHCSTASWCGKYCWCHCCSPQACLPCSVILLSVVTRSS